MAFEDPDIQKSMPKPITPGIVLMGTRRATRRLGKFFPGRSNVPVPVGRISCGNLIQKYHVHVARCSTRMKFERERTLWRQTGVMIHGLASPSRADSRDIRNRSHLSRAPISAISIHARISSRQSPQSLGFAVKTFSVSCASIMVIENWVGMRGRELEFDHTAPQPIRQRCRPSDEKTSGLTLLPDQPAEAVRAGQYPSYADIVKLFY
jgi:hypothetical protein